MGTGDATDTAPTVAVSLLFAAGERPAAAAVVALARAESPFSISYDPSSMTADEGESGGEGARWIELLYNGLTFDLTGLAGGDAAPLPALVHRFGLPVDFDGARLRAVTLRPGPHLAAGGNMPPVLRALALLAARLMELPGVQAVAWHPARCWSEPVRFREAVHTWTQGGVFPVFCLAALASTPDGGMQSEGLAQFTGQELRLEPELVGDRAEAGKLAVRLLHWLYEHGRLASFERLPAPGRGMVRLEPSGNGRFVRAWNG